MTSVWLGGTCMWLCAKCLSKYSYTLLSGEKSHENQLFLSTNNSNYSIPFYNNWSIETGKRDQAYLILRPLWGLDRRTPVSHGEML